jgi:uncharacterized phage-associated protein
MASDALKRVRRTVATMGGDGGMASVLDVAAYILGKIGPMTAMKLQKLCYYCYGYHLAWEEKQLFPERFQAWANGPVAPALYARHRGSLHLNPGQIPGDPEALTVGERESIDLVLASYGEFTASQLSQMTHNEPPWAWARERAGVGPMDRSTETIADEDMFEYFDTLVSAATDGEG